jgi:hypothetical protein
MILGVLLTVLFAYSYDSMTTSSVATGPAASSNRTMVNWDVVEMKWNALRVRAKEDWERLAARVDRG